MTFTLTQAITKTVASEIGETSFPRLHSIKSLWYLIFAVLMMGAASDLQAQAWRAQFTAMSVPTNWCADVAQNVTVTVTNTGTSTWTNASPDINIGCKWNADADYLVRVHADNLAPGDSRTYTFTMTAPATLGTNNLTFDVVREGVCWFAWNSGGCGPGNAAYTSPAVIIRSASTAPTAIGGNTTICSGSSTTLTASGGTAGTGATFQWYADGCGTGSVLGTGASITVSPTTTTTYYVRRTNLCNTTDCFSTTVTVQDPSSVGTISNAGPINFCNGSGNFTTPVTVTGHTGTVVWDWGSNNGVWNNNWVPGASSGVCCFPKQISNSNGTADRIRVRATNGVCPTATSATILIRELANEAPASLTSTINNVCEGTSGTLTATFPAVVNLRGTVQFFSGSCGGTLIATVTPTGGTTVSTTFTPPVGSTTYYARYNPGTGTGCAVTECTSVTVNVQQPQGNPAVFGTGNTWNMYAWNAGNNTGGGGAWTNNYSGFYTINSLNFDTRLGQTYSTAQSWNQTTQSPSDAAGYSGCIVAPDYHSYAAKRQGFTCGVYQINIPNHDDAAILRINGAQVWSHTDGCCDAHANVWTGVLGPTSTVELYISEGEGGSHGSLQFVNVGSLAITSSSATMCSAAAARTLTANYGTGTWSGTGVSGNTFNPTGLDGTYTITYSWQGCTVTQNITVTPTPSAVTVTPSPAYGCGSVTLNTSGGTPGTMYWQNTTSNGSSTATPLTSQTVSTNGTYYFRALNNGCWSTQGSSVVSIYNLTGTFSYSNPTTCGNSGTITVSGVSGGTGTYEYSRNNGTTWQSSPSFTSVPAGTHIVQVRNSTAPNCATTLGSCTLYQPYSPISAVPTVSNSGPVCPANTITLTASGLAPGSGASNSGGAYTFNGTSQYMNSTSSAGLPTGSVATVEAWINRNASQADGSYNGIVSWGPRACSGTSMLFSIQNTGRLSMATWCNDFVPGTGPIVPANTWTHVALVVNGTSVTFYINGQIAQSGTLPLTPVIQAAVGQAFNIGSTDNPGRYFGGSIDNVRIWSVARTQAQIQNDMYKQVPTTGTIGTNLKAIYNFNANTNNSYGTGPNLTAINAPASMTPAFYTYTWSNTGGAPNPTASTNAIQTTPIQNTAGTFAYSVTASANGCSGTVSSATNVVIHPNPDVSISADYCYIGGKVLLSAVSNITPATYAWNTGATTQNLLVDIAGTYQVTVTVSATGCTGTALRSVAQELVVNGDFSAGPTGFTTAPQYTNQQGFYVAGDPSSGLFPEGKYAVNNWATSYHPLFFGVDHTSGTGNFLMVNGSAAATPPVVWQQGPVAVLPNTDYYFSAWAMSLNNIPPYAQLRFSVNGVQVGTTAALTAGPSSTAGIHPSNWVRFYGVWNSGAATSAVISIVDNELAPGGNDFGLDDISFGTLSTFIELVSATGTDNQTSCINHPIENIVYKVGSGPTGPVVTGLPPGVTSFFNGVTVTLSGTPTTPGTYDYTLAITGNCAPAYEYGTITVRGLQLNSTWLGSASGSTPTDWFDADNWSDCVPGNITNVAIPKGRPSYPAITNTSIFDIAPKGKGKAKKVDMGSTGTGATPTLDIQNGAELRVNE